MAEEDAVPSSVPDAPVTLQEALAARPAGPRQAAGGGPARFDLRQALHYNAMVLIVCGVVFELTLRLWLRSPLYAQVPAALKGWGIAGGYALACWMLIAGRAK